MTDLNNTAKRTATAELLVHKNRASKFYRNFKKTTDLTKQDRSILSLCFDFMSTVDLPKLPVQEVYYYRQLSVNTFGIHNMNNNSVFCYVYHEGIGRKTPDDVCSFLIHYLENYVSNEYEELHLFCDNCGG